MPVQHASDRVLQAMGRRTSRAELEALIAELRREIPDIALRTTLITGFPGETAEDHELLKEFVRSMRFERLGVFPYSKEEGTKIRAVQRCLLCNENQLLRAALRQKFRLLHQTLHGHAPVIAADTRNRTVGAVLAAALCDFQIGNISAGRIYAPCIR